MVGIFGPADPPTFGRKGPELSVFGNTLIYFNAIVCLLEANLHSRVLMFMHLRRRCPKALNPLKSAQRLFI